MRSKLEQIGIRMKFESERETYQHIVVNIVPSIVKLAHTTLEPVHVLHRVLEAVGIHRKLPVLAQPEGSFSHVREITVVDILLKRAQVSLAAVQLNDPACLCRDLLADCNRNSAGMQRETLRSGGMAHCGMDSARKLLRSDCCALP
jgi:hypothetical protein